MSLDAQGKRTRKYELEDYTTPYQKLKSRPKVEDYLKPGISLAQMDQVEGLMSDTESARKLAVAKD